MVPGTSWGCGVLVPSALCGGDWFHLLVTPGNSGAGWLLALIPAPWGNLGDKSSTMWGNPVSSARHHGHYPFETGSYSLTEAGLKYIVEAWLELMAIFLPQPLVC